LTWVRIDDSFAQHPKVIAAGPLAMAMQVAALCYCNKHLTDGFIPWSAAQNLISWEFAGTTGGEETTIFKVCLSLGTATDDVTCQTVINMLVASGLWDEVQGGYRIHDYLKYQPSRAEILALRETKSRAGKASGLARQKHSGSTAVEHHDKHHVEHGAEQVLNKLPNKNATQGSGSGGSGSTEGRGSGGGKPSPAPVPQQNDEQPVQPASAKGEDARSMLVRVYGQEVERRTGRKPTAPESSYTNVAEWLARSNLKEDELRYCINCLLDEPRDNNLPLLPSKADGYLARRSHDDFETAPMLGLPACMYGDDLEPGVTILPLGFEWGPDDKVHRMKPGTPLPPGCFWGPDGEAHRPNEPPPRPAAPPPGVPREKYVVVRDEEKIAKAKAQLAAMAKRDAEAKAAAAASSPEAKS